MTSGATALSFNEIEALGTKAARGAGLGWGQAEDLGRSARRLAAHGFDWSQPLLALLDDESAPSRAAILMQGADRASTAQAGETWAIADTAGGLVLPMLAGSIYGRDVALVLRGAEHEMVLWPDGRAGVMGSIVSPGLGGPIEIEVTRDPPPQSRALVCMPRPSTIAPSALARLMDYADRTAVPASEKSRMRGAGSTLSDND